MLDLCLLGCGGSLPVPQRGLTSLLLSYNGRKILIDCGEGTQVSMKILGWGFKTIDVICFTHAHADHVVGLPGLLLTIANSEREEPLTIIGPPGFLKILNGLRVLCPQLPYDINFIEANLEGGINLSIDDLSIHSLALDHTVSCVGYSIYVARARKFDPNKARANNIPVTLWSKLQKGETVEQDGITYHPDMVLGESRQGLKLSYFTDTRPFDGLIEFVKDSDLLIAEGMYAEDNEIDKAIKNKHMLFSEAATIARDANVKELWLTHFSPSLSNPEDYIENASSIFSNTVIGSDRLTKKLTFPQNS
ncbi:Ribonuclease Z [Clostridium sp. N3C]|uniref:ribonuclease Z n=1 Tax=Clostridium sp. N3C TaxID=1776758 RepID=UPI00092E0F08|nr:ribonuclease Z [Clostridium sp. N3C]SCN23476.1 Ribonuclease Z [Clostridium sp. N3C]